jgi:hypothetical protein
MKNKKISILVTMIFIMIASVMATGVTITSNTTTVHGTEDISFSCALNVTSSCNFNVYSDSGYSTSVYSNSVTNSSTCTIRQAGSSIEGGTTYYVEFNGTANDESQSTYSCRNSLTTTAYSITGSGRILLGLFTLILVGLFTVGAISLHFKSGSTNPKSLIVAIAVAVFLALFIARWITAMLLA